MKVKVTWRNKNPFTPRIENLGRVSEAELPDETTFEEIEEFAIDATPEGFFLKYIGLPDYIMEYEYCDTSKKKKRIICQRYKKEPATTKYSDMEVCQSCCDRLDREFDEEYR
ncbi:hypothetical protein LJB84_02665 [Bacteroidales bacterium OttesenSCG-928-J19]|nr:hypothetical protein [Bacteroidales bacterium OttesenSCG-928-J19]